MAIVDLQRRIHEAGRIRIGQQVETSGGKTRPAKLDTFRLTSPDRTRIVNAANLYGGTPRQWQAPAGQQWEVITETDRLPVLVLPSDLCFTQWLELWSAGGCQRRCDGVKETISDGPCLCDAENRQCDIHTRLSLMLKDLVGMGLWRLDTQGYYAAVELQGAVEIIGLAAGRGHMLPATLRLEQRMVKRPDTGTRRFAVPVVDVDISPAQLLSGNTANADFGLTTPPEREGLAAGKSGARAAENGMPPPSFTLPPGEPPQSTTPSIAEQAAAVDNIEPRRRRGQVAVPSTGLAPRTVAQAAQTAAPPPPPFSASGGGAAQSAGAPHVSQHTGAPAPEPDEPQEDSGDVPALPATTAQNRKMHALFREAGLEERDDRLTVTAHILGYRLSTSKGLTKLEASKVIDTLQDWIDDTETPVADRVNDILNEAAIAQAEAEAQERAE